VNLLDRLISWFSPSRSLRRSRARAAEQVALSYEGAKTGRRLGGWNASSSSGNAEMGPALSKLRNNAENLVQNNAFANKSVRRWCRRVVGYGITPQADTGSEQLNATIDRLWERWARQCCSDKRLNFGAALRQVVRTTYVRGECLIRLRDRFTTDGLAIPFQIQVQEPDYLDIDKTQWLGNGVIVHGVEFDLLGNLRGFWLFSQHPGDPIQTSARGVSTSSFVPAQYVIHHVPLERPGDVRGVSRFASVISKLRDLDEYADAEIVRKKIEACLAMFVGQPEGADGPTLGSAITDSDGNKIEEMRPGMIAYGQPGMKPEFLAPTSGGDYATHKKVELKEIFAGLDAQYVVNGNDLEATNYSSFRGGAVDERDAIDEYRWLWLIPQVLDPIWRKFIDTLYVIGEIPTQHYGVKWNPPPFDMLDRAQEAEADRLEMQIGKTTWPQVVGNQGQDPTKQIKEITKWKPLLEAAGVTFAASTSESSSDSEGNNGQGTNPKAPD
jgi:lambda family phage portal protein